MFSYGAFTYGSHIYLFHFLLPNKTMSLGISFVKEEYDSLLHTEIYLCTPLPPQMKVMFKIRDLNNKFQKCFSDIRLFENELNKVAHFVTHNSLYWCACRVEAQCPDWGWIQ